jgi:hypothetical protein
MTTYAAVFALVLGYVALVGAYCALRSLSRLRKAATILGRGGQGRESLLEATHRHIELTQALAEQVEQMRVQVQATQDATAQDLQSGQQDIQQVLTGFGSSVERSLRNVALVRFDAFDDMSGRLSFALAMLDDSGNGVTLTSIAGGTESRLYAKGVSQGNGEHELSPEETQAVKAALTNRAAAVRDSGARDSGLHRHVERQAS